MESSREKLDSSIRVNPSDKSSRQQSTPIRAALAVFFFVFLYHGISPSREVDVSGKSERSSDEAYFLHRWTTHVTEHPIQARDRTGFAEMGLRTRMYARLLQHPSLPSFDAFESALWPFVPGIGELRRTYLDGTRTGHKESKRGIVMSLGQNGFEFAVQFITMLRETHKSTLPVEIYYYGDNDLPLSMRTYLTTSFTNIRTIDVEILNFFDPALVQLDRRGWALKPFALVATNLSEVILTDADTVFLTNPENLFKDAGYKRTGTYFFHDRDHYREGASVIIHDFLKDQLGKGGPSRELSSSAFWKKKGIYQQESGVVVVDKRRIEVFAALLFAAWQNTGSVRDLTTYRVFWGDKESYWLAFELSRFPYHFSKYYAGGIGEEDDKDGPRLCSDHPLHMLGDEDDSIDGFEPDQDDEGEYDEFESGKLSNIEHKKKEKASFKGKLAWFNGSVYQAKHKGDGKLIRPSRWAMHGEWEFLEKEELWCLRNFTAFDTYQSELGSLLPSLLDSASRKLKAPVVDGAYVQL